MADDKAIEILSRLSSLKTQRTTWESHWQEVADFVVPRKADVTKNRSPMISAQKWFLMARQYTQLNC